MELIAETSEKAVAMFDIKKIVLQKNGLEFGKIITITCDNTNSMFGGKDRGEKTIYITCRSKVIFYINNPSHCLVFLRNP